MGGEGRIEQLEGLTADQERDILTMRARARVERIERGRPTEPARVHATENPTIH